MVDGLVKNKCFADNPGHLALNLTNIYWNWNEDHKNTQVDLVLRKPSSVFHLLHNNFITVKQIKKRKEHAHWNTRSIAAASCGATPHDQLLPRNAVMRKFNLTITIASYWNTCKWKETIRISTEVQKTHRCHVHGEIGGRCILKPSTLEPLSR
jgi:hypothetical protein